LRGALATKQSGLPISAQGGLAPKARSPPAIASCNPPWRVTALRARPILPAAIRLLLHFAHQLACDHGLDRGGGHVLADSGVFEPALEARTYVRVFLAVRSFLNICLVSARSSVGGAACTGASGGYSVFELGQHAQNDRLQRGQVQGCRFPKNLVVDAVVFVAKRIADGDNVGPRGVGITRPQFLGRAASEIIWIARSVTRRRL
jgi:hypothetical protein